MEVLMEVLRVGDEAEAGMGIVLAIIEIALEMVIFIEAAAEQLGLGALTRTDTTVPVVEIEIAEIAM
jgi:hypothetical protein